MLAFGYAGESQFVNPWIGFCVGMCGWFFILFEIFAGEAGSTSSGTNKYVQASFSTMRLIVTVGWSIYPLGYFFGYLMGAICGQKNGNSKLNSRFSSTFNLTLNSMLD